MEGLPFGESSESVAGNLDPKFFGETVAEVFRQTVVEISSSGDGGILDDERSRSGDSNREPDQGGEGESAERADLKQKSMRRAEVMDDGEGEDEDDCRDRGQGDEGDVDGAMKLLPGPAVIAFGEVGLVVAAHFRREAGNVIAPSREDVSDEWIDTFTHMNL